VRGWVGIECQVSRIELGAGDEIVTSRTGGGDGEGEGSWGIRRGGEWKRWVRWGAGSKDINTIGGR